MIGRKRKKLKLLDLLLYRSTINSWGGVDLMDRMIAHYRHGFKNKKWYLRIFIHFLNISIINSWIIYKENCQNIPLPQFKALIVWTMLQIGKYDTPKRGRPSLQSDESKKKFPL